MNPMDMSWLLLKEEPLPYHGDSPPQPQTNLDVLFAPRRAKSEYQPNRIDDSQFQQYMKNRELSLDNLSEWDSSQLDIAQKHAPSAEIHQRLSDERAKRGYNIIPNNQMVDVGRDPNKDPMPSNRSEGDYIDSVRGDFGERLRDFQQMNAGEAMEISWRMLKELTPDQQAKIDQYNAMGMGAYAEQFKQLFEEQNRVNQQAQETAPVETAQTGLYQQQIDARNAKRAEENRIRAMVKAGNRGDLGEATRAAQKFFEEHGHYPRHFPKSMMRER